MEEGTIMGLDYWTDTFLVSTDIWLIQLVSLAKVTSVQFSSPLNDDNI